MRVEIERWWSVRSGRRIVKGWIFDGAQVATFGMVVIRSRRLCTSPTCLRWLVVVRCRRKITARKLQADIALFVDEMNMLDDCVCRWWWYWNWWFDNWNFRSDGSSSKTDTLLRHWPILNTYCFSGLFIIASFNMGNCVKMVLPYWQNRTAKSHVPIAVPIRLNSVQWNVCCSTRGISLPFLTIAWFNSSINSFSFTLQLPMKCVVWSFAPWSLIWSISKTNKGTLSRCVYKVLK